MDSDSFKAVSEICSALYRTYCQMLRVISSNHAWQEWFWPKNFRSKNFSDEKKLGARHGGKARVTEIPGGASPPQTPPRQHFKKFALRANFLKWLKKEDFGVDGRRRNVRPKNFSAKNFFGRKKHSTEKFVVHYFKKGKKGNLLCGKSTSRRRYVDVQRRMSTYVDVRRWPSSTYVVIFQFSHELVVFWSNC